MIKLIPRNLGKHKNKIKHYSKDLSESSKREFKICKVHSNMKNNNKVVGKCNL